jgi:hypothetical protein
MSCTHEEAEMPKELTPEEQKALDDQIAADKAAEDARKAKLSAEELEAERIEALVQDRVKEAKLKLDGAYGQRDEALAKLALLEKEKRERELKELEEAGKHKEAYELRIAERDRENEALRVKNTELTRDLNLKGALAAYTFRNERAQEMAYSGVVGQLVQNEQGVWVHKSGTSITDFVAAYAKDEDNAFLFKSKNSSGSGLGQPKIADPANTPKSLFGMSQDEVLKLAAEGKLPQR